MKAPGENPQLIDRNDWDSFSRDRTFGRGFAFANMINSNNNQYGCSQ